MLSPGSATRDVVTLTGGLHVSTTCDECYSAVLLVTNTGIVLVLYGTLLQNLHTGELKMRMMRGEALLKK